MKKVNGFQEFKRTSKRNPEIIVKEVESLRSTVQTLIRATHPMGKLLDFLQVPTIFRNKKKLFSEPVFFVFS